MSNLHQGWTKLVQNLWYATCDGGGLAALVYTPSRVETEVDGTKVAVEEQTDYPFREEIRFNVLLSGSKKHPKAAFPLHLRVPGWCAGPESRLTANLWRSALRVKELSSWRAGRWSMLCV